MEGLQRGAHVQRVEAKELVKILPTTARRAASVTRRGVRRPKSATSKRRVPDTSAATRGQGGASVTECKRHELGG